MTRLEKVEYLKEKGYTYEPQTGNIISPYGNKLNAKTKLGYLAINLRKFRGAIFHHHYAWFITYGNVDFEMLDHINRDKTDNRICNLRITDSIMNGQNQNAKGYSWHKKTNKWFSKIVVNKEIFNLGYFNTEEEARNAYLQAKEKYHII
jgi:hypothetical protein